MTQLSINTPELTAEQKAEQTASRLMYSHYSQLDPEWGFEFGTERTMCGLVSVKSIIDHYNYKVGIESPDINTLLEIVNDANDNKANGISHAVEVDMLKGQGLLAWRRNWDAPSTDVTWLVDNEHYSPEQVEAVNTQQLQELAYDDVHDRQLLSITRSLNDENPVIASVKQGFGGNSGDHQVVIVGRELTKQGDTFIIMDPEHAPGSTLHTEPVERFFQFFNNRAIFVKQ